MTCKQTRKQTQTKQKEVIMSKNNMWENYFSKSYWHTPSMKACKKEDKLCYKVDTEKEPKKPRPCSELESHEDAREIRNLIEEKLEEEKRRDRKKLEEWELEPIPSQYRRICIDGLLGKYEYDNATNKGKITLYSKPILKTADELGIDPFYLSAFVEAHEYAHAKMCQWLNIPVKYHKNSGSRMKNHKNAAYLYVEEGLANAYALKVFEKSPYFSKLCSFVSHQAPHYRFGLELYNKYGNRGEVLAKRMILWKEFKSRDSDYKKFLNKLFS